MSERKRGFMKKIFLVRHGETEWALSGRHTGRTDIPLTKNGEKQAENLSPLLQNIPFNKSFVSPSQRASRTFDILRVAVAKEIDPDLAEWDYGTYEGLTSSQIREKCPDWTIFSKGASGGESLNDIQKRATRVLEKIKKCEGNVLVCSSGHFLRALTTCWLKTPLAFGDQIPLQTASLSILGYEKEDPSLLLWNYTKEIVF